MEMNDFLKLRGLTETDRVDVNGLMLQNYIKKCLETEDKLERAYDAEETRMKEIAECREEIKELKRTNKYLLEAASTNAKLLKEVEDLKYKLSLSNMFLDRRKEKDAINAYKQNISVDLRV